MRKFKRRQPRGLPFRLFLSCGGRVAAAGGFRPVRECPRLTPFLRF